MKPFPLQSIKIALARAFAGSASQQVRSYYANNFPNISVRRSVKPEIGVELLKSTQFPDDLLNSHMTCGVSRYRLRSVLDGKPFRCEFSLTVPADCPFDADLVLEDVSKNCIATLTALVPGTTFHYPFAERFQDDRLSITGIFAWSGVWLDSERICLGSVRTVPIVLVELVPITLRELHEVKNHLDDFIESTIDGRIDLFNAFR